MINLLSDEKWLFGLNPKQPQLHTREPVVGFMDMFTMNGSKIGPRILIRGGMTQVCNSRVYRFVFINILQDWFTIAPNASEAPLKNMGKQIMWPLQEPL